jgi:hypothetical protein
MMLPAILFIAQAESISTPCPGTTMPAVFKRKVNADFIPMELGMEC